MSGLFLQRVLLATLTVAGWIASTAAANTQAKRVVVPVGTVGESEVAAVIPGEREMLYMLLMNAVFIIWNLVKQYWDAHKKKTDTSAQDIQEMKLFMQTMVNDMKSVKEKLEKVPTEKEVELKIYQITRQPKNL